MTCYFCNLNREINVENKIKGDNLDVSWQGGGEFVYFDFNLL